MTYIPRDLPEFIPNTSCTGCMDRGIYIVCRTTFTRSSAKYAISEEWRVPFFMGTPENKMMKNIINVISVHMHFVNIGY